MRNNIKKLEPLKKYTTFRAGGRAAFFACAQSVEELRLLVCSAGENKLPVRIIGGGSNILAADRLKRSLVVKLSGPKFKKIEFNGKRAYAGAAVMIQQLISKGRARGLGGVEFLTGVPASVGGAMMMNAGAWGQNLSNLVERITLMDYNGKIRILGRKDVKFSYRSSGLDDYIILGCSFLLKKKSPKEISGILKRNLLKRKLTQDLSYPSAGCIFKNSRNDSAGRPALSAGRLIDACGLKGKRIGGAQVSEKHANFIINKNKAKSSDILRLIRIIRRDVRKKFNIELKPEIKIWR